MQTATPEQFEALQDIAQQNDGRLRSYSGRGMYGAQCLGITTEYPNSVIEDAGAAGIKGARQDSMGLKTIVYWPKIGVPDYFKED
ncbi:MAG: hypothetical protein KF754_01705 [Planctomycetes bacterium]|nr:hypothetical protein [Planctomycetota bacterium]